MALHAPSTTEVGIESMLRRQTTKTMSMARVAGICVVASGLLAGCGPVDVAGFPWVDFFVGLINFGIFAWVIIKFGGPFIQEFFANRREEFLREMNAAQEARKEAEARLAEYDEKLEALEQERQALLDEYHAQGEREKQRLVETAKRQVEKMRDDAESLIDQEVKKAVAMLEEQAVDLAVQMAAEKATEKLDEKQQQQLFERYVSGLQNSETTLN